MEPWVDLGTYTVRAKWAVDTGGDEAGEAMEQSNES